MSGAVEILCKEIEYPFDPRLERTDLLVAFVAELVGVVRDGREVEAAIVKMTGRPPSEGSGEVLKLAEAMLSAQNTEDMIEAAAGVHEACRRLNPEGAYPTDHLIDMLQSCASALRFGLEQPCRSRHAADAANHVWKRTYGVGRFDKHTPPWSKAWARTKLHDALLSLLPPPNQGHPKP